MGLGYILANRRYETRLKPIFISLLFVVISLLWFYFSDQFIVGNTHSIHLFLDYSIDTDFVYAIIASLVLYFLIKNNNNTLNGVIKSLAYHKEQLDIIVTAVQHADESILITDLEGQLKWANDKYYEVTGFTREESIDKPIPYAIKKEQNEQFYKDMESQVQNGIPWKGILVNKKKNGQLYHESLSFAPVKNSDGQIYRYITVFRDITVEHKNRELIKHSLKEKEALLTEIHHRVKNNLATVTGLIDLQLIQTDEVPLINLLSNIQVRIKSIALVHEKLYQDYLFSEIRLDTYLEDLTKNIDDIFTNLGLPVYMNKNISCLLDIEPILIDMNKAVPFGLLATELITNAYKHAFPNNQKGHIHITLKKQNDDMYYFKVKDNGVGIVDDSLLDQPHTTGFQLIQTLSNQLQAKWQVDLKNGFGVTFKFDFKHLRKPNRTETQNQLKLL